MSIHPLTLMRPRIVGISGSFRAAQLSGNVMQQQERILFHEYGTQLRVAADDSLILNVSCGRVGEFGVEFALDDHEREEYRRRGDAFIKELSRAVQRDWRPFVARGRTC